MPIAVEAPETPPSTEGRKQPTLARRLAVSAIRLIIVALISALFGGGWYLAKKGFGRQWRTLVVEELHKHGVEASVRRLTLNPFRGLVAQPGNFGEGDPIELGRFEVEWERSNVYPGDVAAAVGGLQRVQSGAQTNAHLRVRRNARESILLPGRDFAGSTRAQSGRTAIGRRPSARRRSSRSSRGCAAPGRRSRE